MHDSGRFSEEGLGTGSSRFSDDLSIPINTSRSDPTSSVSCLETPRASDSCPSGTSNTAENKLRSSFALDLSPRPRHLLEHRRRERAPRSYALDLSKAEGPEGPEALDLCASRNSNYSETSADSRGSSPEPPVSPRPKGLANHPRILKDKLHNFSLPSRFTKYHESW